MEYHGQLVNRKVTHLMYNFTPTHMAAYGLQIDVQAYYPRPPQLIHMVQVGCLSVVIKFVI